MVDISPGRKIRTHVGTHPGALPVRASASRDPPLHHAVRRENELRIHEVVTGRISVVGRVQQAEGKIVVVRLDEGFLTFGIWNNRYRCQWSDRFRQHIYSNLWHRDKQGNETVCVSCTEGVVILEERRLKILAFCCPSFSGSTMPGAMSAISFA